jgi:hypothetical protein
MWDRYRVRQAERLYKGTDAPLRLCYEQAEFGIKVALARAYPHNLPQKQIGQVANSLGVSQRTVYDYVVEGRVLVKYKIKSPLEEWLEIPFTSLKGSKKLY